LIRFRGFRCRAEKNGSVSTDKWLCCRARRAEWTVAIDSHAKIGPTAARARFNPARTSECPDPALWWGHDSRIRPYFNCNFELREGVSPGVSRPASENHPDSSLTSHKSTGPAEHGFPRVQSKARRGRAESALKPVAPVLPRQDISAILQQAILRAVVGVHRTSTNQAQAQAPGGQRKRLFERRQQQR